MSEYISSYEFGVRIPAIIETKTFIKSLKHVKGLSIQFHSYNPVKPI